MIDTIGKKLFLYVLTLLMGVTLLFSGGITPAFAAATGVNFDRTDIMDDLSGATINGKVFDIRDYPFDENGSVQVISFMEYCYSYKANMRANYGLYFYLYNPRGLNLSANSKMNKVQMAVRYDTDGNPNDYEKFDLLFCAKSEESNYKNLFYKFKLVDKAVNGKPFAERVNSNERRYDVSGIELLTYGDKNATEYGVDTTYRFRGFAEGYGSDASAKNTLEIAAQKLETIELSVRHTFYRTQTSIKGAGYRGLAKANSLARRQSVVLG